MAVTTNTTCVALVTGGSRGIGAATARALAQAGHDVALTYQRFEVRAKEVVAELEGLGRRAIAIRAHAGDTRTAVARTVAELGRLDVLVANAGVYLGAPLSEAELDVFDRQMDVNVRGVFVAAQAAQPHLGDGGRII